jgi:hypothetical protein
MCACVCMYACMYEYVYIVIINNATRESACIPHMMYVCMYACLSHMMHVCMYIFMVSKTTCDMSPVCMCILHMMYLCMYSSSIFTPMLHVYVCAYIHICICGLDTVVTSDHDVRVRIHTYSHQYVYV